MDAALTSPIPDILMSSPAYLYKGARGCYSVSLEEELLNNRTAFLNGRIEMDTAREIYLKFNYLALSDDPIRLIICSDGGDTTPGRAIYDMMQGIHCEVHTVCLGRAASMAAILLAAGAKGHRMILPNSSVLIHEVLVPGGIGGSATNISRISQSINETRDIMNGILARHTGKSTEEINQATAFDNYMDAEQAVAFGICDVITNQIF